MMKIVQESTRCESDNNCTVSANVQMLYSVSVSPTANIKLFDFTTIRESYCGKMFYRCPDHYFEC